MGGILMFMEDFERLVGRIEATPGRVETRLVAIDGRGGAGKSSLAGKLVERLPNAAVVQVDDFWLPRDVRPDRERVVLEPGSDYDWVRLRDQVVEPLSKGKAARFQRYDWQSDTLMEWHDVAVGGTVIAEGVFSLREELSPYYDVRVWVETDPEECLKRGIERDGEQHRDLWENEWMKAYEGYIEKSDPAKRADWVMRGA
jgi:uridine kinase